MALGEERQVEQDNGRPSRPTNDQHETEDPALDSVPQKKREWSNIKANTNVDRE